MPDELYNDMKEQRFESCPNINKESSNQDDEEISVEFISFSAYQVHTMDPIVV